ncbi:hypothetical protein WMY93_014011 [Mugilogobius chulae]|uniref:Uncharacterized protein n=1 Tax=Mugilogobius chulae TaxID=88201 RepID=A0AAW0P4C7_9GOBI
MKQDETRVQTQTPAQRTSVDFNPEVRRQEPGFVCGRTRTWRSRGGLGANAANYSLYQRDRAQQCSRWNSSLSVLSYLSGHMDLNGLSESGPGGALLRAGRGGARGEEEGGARGEEEGGPEEKKEEPEEEGEGPEEKNQEPEKKKEGPEEEREELKEEREGQRRGGRSQRKIGRS